MLRSLRENGSDADLQKPQVLECISVSNAVDLLARELEDRCFAHPDAKPLLFDPTELRESDWFRRK